MLPNQKPLLGTLLDRTHPLSAGLIGAWLFNEGAGTTAMDSSGNGWHGVFAGTSLPTWSRDQYGNSAVYIPWSSPVYSSIQLPPGLGAMLTGCPGASLVASCLQDSSAGERGIVGITVSAGATRKLAMGYLTTAMYAGGQPTASGDSFRYLNSVLLGGIAWQQLAGVVRIYNDTIALYCNGVVINDNPPSSGWTSTAFSADVGTSHSIGYASSAKFQGIISYVYVYNRILGPEEVRALYLAPYQMFREPRSRRVFVPAKV